LFVDELVPESVIEGRLVFSDARVITKSTLIQAVNETPPLDVQHRIPTFLRPAGDGSFRLAGLPQGVFTLSVRGLADGWAVDPIQVRIEQGQTQKDITVPIEPSVLVRGIVLDTETGKPLSEAIVGVTPDAPWGGNALAVSEATGRDGRFTVAAPRGAIRVYVAKAPEGYGRSEEVSLDLSPGEPVPPEVQLKLGPWQPDALLIRAAAPKGGARGRVVDETGNPVSGAHLRCGAAFEAARPGYGSRTKADGCFEFGQLEAGVDYTITIPEWSTTAFATDRFTVDADAVLDLGDITVARRDTTGRVEGVVVDEKSRPLRNAWVHINQIDWVQTDSSGRFRVDVFDNSTDFAVRVDAASYRSKTVQVVPGRECRIELEPVRPGD
jgi:protocatechuate 3,4-dioxygenase beta subunit